MVQLNLKRNTDNVRKVSIYKKKQLMGNYYSCLSIEEVQKADINGNFDEAEILINVDSNHKGQKYSYIRGAYYMHLNQFGKLNFIFLDNQLYRIEFMPRLTNCYLKQLKDSLNIDIIQQNIHKNNTIEVFAHFDKFYVNNIWVIWTDTQLAETFIQPKVDSILESNLEDCSVN